MNLLKHTHKSMIGYDLMVIIIRFIEGDVTISLSKIHAQQEQATYTGFDFPFGHLPLKINDIKNYNKNY